MAAIVRIYFYLKLCDAIAARLEINCLATWFVRYTGCEKNSLPEG